MTSKAPSSCSADFQSKPRSGSSLMLFWLPVSPISNRQASEHRKTTAKDKVLCRCPKSDIFSSMPRKFWNELQLFSLALFGATSLSATELKFETRSEEHTSE